MNKQRFLILTLSVLTAFFQLLGCRVSMEGGDGFENIEYDLDERKFVRSSQNQEERQEVSQNRKEFKSANKGDDIGAGGD